MGKRRIVQAIWAVLTNSYVTGFARGRIYQGNLKNVCVPGLNCYSCPGAVGSCPIGALQSVLNDSGLRFTFYVAGFLMVIGAFFGRFVCGWLCPFGLIQELLHKIPSGRKIKTFRGDRQLRWLKYAILAIFVVLLPMFVLDAAGVGVPYFCKLICPAGTLEAGIPLVLLDGALRSVIGWLYAWKLAILAAVVVLSVFIYRPFCRYLCPLGAIYAPFNRIAFYRIGVDMNKCTGCGSCDKACRMNIRVRETPNCAECVRCGDCRDACPEGAIRMGLPNDPPVL